MTDLYQKYTDKNFLDKISYTSKFKQSLKQISLSKTPLDEIFADIDEYGNMFTNEFSTNEILIGFRFKSIDSLQRKIERVLKQGGGFKQCFNDVLGFRLHIPKYPVSFPNYFRVVDMRKGKTTDDGYRAIHLYYQKDSHSYPIEIQLWDDKDFIYNTWSHKYLYKTKFAYLGKQLREEYDDGKIKSIEGFSKRLSTLQKGVDKNER